MRDPKTGQKAAKTTTIGLWNVTVKTTESRVIGQGTCSGAVLA